jgi:hypothetical protein
MLPQRRQPPRAILGCLTSPVKRPGQGRPALRPAPGLLARVALGPCPSRHDLRRCCMGLMVLQSSWFPLFGRFSSTMALADSRRPCVTVVSLRGTVRALRRWARSDPGAPGARTRCCRACQGASTPPGAGPPCRSGMPAGAFRVGGARRHPGWPWRGSIPCLHVPLATLHGLRYHNASAGAAALPAPSQACVNARLHVPSHSSRTPQEVTPATARARSLRCLRGHRLG